MTTRSHCGRRAVACALVAIAAAAVSVTGKPHQCLTQDDYTRAVLAQYFPAGASSKVIELTPTELSEPASYRASRSGDHGPGAQTPPTVTANPPPPVGHGHLDGLQPPQHNAADVQTAAAAVPCKAAVADRSHGNDTSSAITVEKLAAFYEQLKGQQETLARQQFQQQLYEQQQRRQQEFSLVQQQIQQQYFQQQQHALLMLDQMRKNPAFVGQLAAFVGHNATSSTARNETKAEPHVATALNAAVPEVAARGGGAKKPQPPTPPQKKEQTIAKHMDAERDDDDTDADDEDDFVVKRLDARQVARKHVASPSDARHRPVMEYDDDEDDNGGFEDDQTPPRMEKVSSE